MQHTEKERKECEVPDAPRPVSKDKFVNELILNLLREENVVNRAVLFAEIFKITLTAKFDPLDFIMLLQSIGLHAYEQGDNKVAEAAFRGAVSFQESVSMKNNLAYIMRKSNEASNQCIKEIIDYLLEGIQEKDTCSIINMALVFSLMLGSEDDWMIADQLIGLINRSSIAAVQWWQELGEKDDPEGHLVHLWLQRHHILVDSALGTRQFLWEKVKTAYPNVPAWLNDVLVPATPN